ncbi:class I SAM-dependent methyltransferase [Hyphomicrobium sp.]|uniref:class I SAM-dependent methyltransferase n=1 Tax=Hyphomicrobium sp. TaxID=82 RepID=UPI0039C871AF
MTECRSQDSLPFLRAWAADPGRVGAIMPSGPALAELITSEISASTGPIVELGPGTGVFTQALIQRGVAESDLTLIETAPDFADLLRARFPRARVLQIDAGKLPVHRLYDEAPVGAIVSGLPLLNMGPRKIMAILSGAFSYARPRAAFYQFTYGPRCPVPRFLLDRLDLKAKFIGRAFFNMPPAAVYRITAPTSARASSPRRMLIDA